MLVEETIDKLIKIRLKTMALAFRDLIESPELRGMSAQEAVALLVEREWAERENRRMATLMKQAKIGTSACLENILYPAGRGIDKTTIRSFATCRWVQAKQNIIIHGATGTGKSYLGDALGNAACRMGHATLRARVPRLLQELAVARVDGSYVSTLNRIARVKVLILDDFLIAPLKDVERRDLLEILEDRYDKGSTVIASQVPPKSWHGALEDPTIADAICDRVVHNAHTIWLKGPSVRKTKGQDSLVTSE